MQHFLSPTALLRFARRRWLLCGLLAAVAGCWLVFGFGAALATPGGPTEQVTAPSGSEPPTVPVIRPRLRTIVRTVGQPSFVESYERTSIYPKVTGYIQKWNVDIGDRVKKGQTLATLYVPELREDWQTKKRTVKLDQDRVELAQQVVRVAGADVQAAEARLKEARATLDQYQAQVERWDSEVRRLRREVRSGVVDPQVLLESENQLKASTAARDAARAVIAKAEAELLSRKATLVQDKIDVNVARDQEAVADSDAKRVEAWVGYLTLPAPFDGVVVARNANTWDFVMPLTGDPSADHNAPHLSPGGKAAPVYVIDRTDVVRIFVDIPEADANYVHPGTRASVLVRAFRDQWIPATVTRTSWALNVKSRTLRAEIDLRNTAHPDVYQDPGSHDMAEVPSHNGIQLLPGMYAYGKVIIERPRVWALPESALVHVGEKTFYWGYEKGHAVKMEVQTGVSDGEWIEVTNRRVPSKSTGGATWAPVNGSEKVIADDLSALTEGAPVRVGDTATKGEGDRARLTSPPQGTTTAR
jgi:multidrug efflux pump subunit AcrA (membrane-fusion protein)